MKRKKTIVLAILSVVAVLMVVLIAEVGKAIHEKANEPKISFVSNGDGTCYVAGASYGVGNLDLVIPKTSPDGETVVAIKTRAFAGNVSLVGIYIPETVTSIGDFALDAYNLQRITVAEENPCYKDIDGTLYSKDGRTLIKYCGGRREPSFVIPRSVETVEACAFAGSKFLNSITVSGRVENIGECAFEGCYRLVEVINHSLINIDKSTDNGHIGCRALTIHSGESKILVVDDFVFITYRLTDLLVGYIGTDSDITLPEVFDIGQYQIYEFAFCKSTDIRRVTIPESVEAIGKNAFFECDNLKSVAIKSGVQSIQAGAFGACPKLKSVVFENTNGWKAYDVDLSSGELSDPAIAAEYLRSTYSYVLWIRE